MKHMVLALLLSAVQPWLSSTLAETNEKGDEVQVHVFVGDEGNAWVAKSECTGTTSECDSKGVILVSAEVVGAEDGRSDPGGVKVRTIKIRKLGGAKNRGWLGVSIGVAESLAGKANTENEGVLVVNVVSDSPADRAGFEVHDIILTVNGEDVVGGVGPAIDLIKGHKPGDEVEMVILRDGQERTLEVTLGSRADMKNLSFSWKFEGMPEGRIEEHIKVRGKMLLRDPEGEWIFKDLGDLDALKNLPDNIRMFAPKGGHSVISITNDSSNNNGKRTVNIVVDRDGSTIELEQEDGGDITVRRTDEDGDETSAVYATEDELRDADEEAYELYSRSNQKIFVHIDGLGDAEDQNFNFNFNMDLPDFDFVFKFNEGELEEHFAEWKSQMEEGFGEAHEAYEHSMEQFKVIMEKLHGEDGMPSLIELQSLGKERFGPLALRLHGLGKPRQTFEVRSDGTIEVHLRKGDSELVQLYDDEDDLADRNPKLFSKYQDLMSADPE